MGDRKHGQRSRKGPLSTGVGGGGVMRGAGGSYNKKSEQSNCFVPNSVGNGGNHDDPQRTSSVVTDAADLNLDQQLAVLDEATELPPFGFNIAGLEKRLQRRLGFEITQSAINGCLSPYYNLREWGDRYVVTSLGAETEDFPGQGNGNHPPLSPLKEFYLFSSDEEPEEDDDESMAGRAGAHVATKARGGATGRKGTRGGVAVSRPRHHRRASSGGSSNGRFGNGHASGADDEEEEGSDAGDDAVDIDSMAED